MNPSAWFHDTRQGTARMMTAARSRALVIAILFVLLALASFAVDQSISLPSQPVKPPALQIPR